MQRKCSSIGCATLVPGNRRGEPIWYVPRINPPVSLDQTRTNLGHTVLRNIRRSKKKKNMAEEIRKTRRGITRYTVRQIPLLLLLIMSVRLGNNFSNVQRRQIKLNTRDIVIGLAGGFTTSRSQVKISSIREYSLLDGRDQPVCLFLISLRESRARGSRRAGQIGNSPASSGVLRASSHERPLSGNFPASASACDFPLGDAFHRFQARSPRETNTVVPAGQFFRRLIDLSNVVTS